MRRRRDRTPEGCQESELELKVYWLQTEAPRADGGVGWPGLSLRGRRDGYPKMDLPSASTRESRRIRAEVTIAEQDVSRRLGRSVSVQSRPDTVGPLYRIDLHPSTGGDSYIDVESCSV